jgi:hypothetical protein
MRRIFRSVDQYNLLFTALVSAFGLTGLSIKFMVVALQLVIIFDLLLFLHIKAIFTLFFWRVTSITNL